MSWIACYAIVLREETDVEEYNRRGMFTLRFFPYRVEMLKRGHDIKSGAEEE
jgi:hypothetical protein